MSILTKNTYTVSADASQRTLRTLAQGAIAVVFAAVIPVIISAVRDGIDKVDWTVLAYSSGTVAVVTFLSYVMAKVLPALNTEDVPPDPEVVIPGGGV